jgi:hypothetical protein
LIKILGTDQFYWDADNIYIYDTSEPLNQIRIGRYHDTNYGIGFTEDGGATWQTAIGFDGTHIRSDANIDLSAGGSITLSSASQITIGTNPLEVGGTNLIPNSYFDITSGLYGFATTTISGLKNSTEYTLSFRGNVATLGTGTSIRCYIYADDWSYSVYAETQSTTETTATLTFTTPANIEGKTIKFGAVSNPNGNGGTVYLRWAKLEKGNIATDWSPSPLDPSSGVKTSYVTINNTGIAMGTGGTFTIGSSNFAIDASGNVTMKGAVTANSGYIGGTDGFTITTGKLYSGKTTLTGKDAGVYIGTDGISLGSAGVAPQFQVTSAGALTATSGAIGAITLGSTGIHSGSGSNFVGWYKPSSIDTNTVSLFAGATDNAGSEADFFVTYSGKLTASDAYVNGTLKAGGYDVWNKKSIQVSSSQPSAPSLGDIWIAPAPPPETPEEDPPYSGNWTTTLGTNVYLNNANGNTLSTTVYGTASGTVSGTYSYGIDIQLRITHAYFSTLYVQVKAGPSGVVTFPTQSFSGSTGFYRYTQTTTSATWIGNSSSIDLVINGGSSSSGMPNNAAGDIGVMSGNVLTLTCTATN